MIELNLWGETVQECACRFLRDARTDDVEPSERMAYCRDRAANCIRLFGGQHEQELRDFYSRVHAYFRED